MGLRNRESFNDRELKVIEYLMSIAVLEADGYLHIKQRLMGYGTKTKYSKILKITTTQWDSCLSAIDGEVLFCLKNPRAVPCCQFVDDDIIIFKTLEEGRNFKEKRNKRLREEEEQERKKSKIGTENLMNKRYWQTHRYISAIYRLKYEDQIIYVGQSATLGNRMLQHSDSEQFWNIYKDLEDGKPHPYSYKQLGLYKFISEHKYNTEVEWVEIDKDKLNEVEKMQIEHDQPRFNCSGVDIHYIAH